MTNSGAIPVLFRRNPTIPVPFRWIPVIPADSGAIPAELPDSGWNLWGTVKYCNWNPTIMKTIRTNHDIKLIMGGNGQTATLTYYITNYATKKQQRSSNASALLAKCLAFIKKEERRQTDLNKLNKKLIQS